MLSLLVLVASVASPTAADVQAAEEARVLESLTDYTRGGRAYVEFAPTVQTRNAVCSRVSPSTFDCSFETRVKDPLAHDFGPWAPRHARVNWTNGCWRQVKANDQAPPFAMFDASSDGRISLDEWRAASARSINTTGLSAKDRWAFVENSIQIFKAADRNGDGFLSGAEYDSISGLQVGPQKIEEIPHG